MRFSIALCVLLLTVGTTSAESTTGCLGVVVPAEQVEVAVEVEGTLRSLSVALGDTITMDQPLAVVEVPGIALQIARAEASLLVARSSIETAQIEVEDLSQQLQRREKVDEAYAQEELESLRAQHRIKEGELDRARAQALEQRAVLDELRERESAQTVLAPFDGVVTLRHQSPGAYVRTGQNLVRIVSLDRPRIRFAVPVEESGWLAPGMALRIRRDDKEGPSATAKVARVSPEVDTALEMIFAEAEFESGDHAGEFPIGVVVRVEPAASGE